MITGAGIDIVEVKRVASAVNRWGEDFLNKVFTSKEIDYARKRRFASEHLAARFATKEAVLKAFGDDKWVDWKNIETFNTESGKPGVRLHGYLEKLSRERNVGEVVVSMSHTKDYAIASAILVKRR